MLADMHTHSKHSHDSKCEIEDMLLSQLEKGTSIFAVTNHFDVDMHDVYDIVTPIVDSIKEVKALREKYSDRCRVLSGYEISEGFWYPDFYKGISLDVDVVIGSVHCVSNVPDTRPYSQIDFSTYTEDELYAYLEAYFNDFITMFETTDFDILAHLTCPLRYIVGIHKRHIDISRFDKKIDEILNRTIKGDKAFEINTSSYHLLDDFMPTAKIVGRYRELGGRLVTLGSDAHVPENASIQFDKAYDLVKRLGFENICYYENRTPHIIEVK